MTRLSSICIVLAFFLRCSPIVLAQSEPPWVSPSLPEGRTHLVCDADYLLTQPFFLKKLPGNVPGVKVAKVVPRVTLAYLPGQDHRGPRGALWSCWGQGCAVDDKYYTAFGDHHAQTMLFEWTAKTGEFRLLADVNRILNQPEGHYTPGKIHTRLTPCSDGWIYYATHNAGARSFKDKQYAGDWIMRTHPQTGQTEIVAHGPAGAESIPVGFADPQRLIFFGGTEQSGLFFAYDLKERRMLYQSAAGEGPQRCMPYAQSTGKLYFRGNMHKNYLRWLDPANGQIKAEGKPTDHPGGVMRCYDVATGKVTVINTLCNPRAATVESPDGVIWIAAWDGKAWKLDVASQRFEEVASLAPGETYIASITMDPAGRYLYYSAGSHGSAQAEGTPLYQFDTQTRRIKVICFLSPATLLMNSGFIANGTYSLSISPDGSTVYTTWNGFRPALPQFTVGKTWDVVAVTAIEIPPAERDAK